MGPLALIQSAGVYSVSNTHYHIHRFDCMFFLLTIYVFFPAAVVIIVSGTIHPILCVLSIVSVVVPPRYALRYVTRTPQHQL